MRDVDPIESDEDGDDILSGEDDGIDGYESDCELIIATTLERINPGQSKPPCIP